MTILCALLDFIGFFVQLVRFSKTEGDERADVLLIVASYLFLIVDFYYVCWLKSVNMSLPPKYREYSTTAMMGFGTKFKRQLSVNALKAKDIAKKGGKAAGRGAKKLAGMYKEKRRSKNKVP